MQNNLQIDNESSKYAINYSILRLVAVFLVIMATLPQEVINLPAQNQESFAALRPLTMLTLLGNVGIPLLVMMSGAFFLNPEKQIRDEAIFKKYIPRAIGIFLLWSLFYALLEQSFFSGIKAQGILDAWQLLDKEQLVKNTLLGHYHMWYVYTLVGLYLVTPILRIITANARKGMIYYFALLCIALTATVTINSGVFHNQYVNQVMTKSNVFMPLGFLGYYILGYTIKKAEKKKLFSVIFALTCLAVLYYTMIWNDGLNPIGTRAPVNLALLSYFSPVVYLLGITIFMIFSEFNNPKKYSHKHEMIADLSKYTGTIYMIFPFVIDVCLRTNTISPVEKWQTLMVNNVIVFFVSLILAVILSLPYKAAKRWFYKA